MSEVCQDIYTPVCYYGFEEKEDFHGLIGVVVGGALSKCRMCSKCNCVQCIIASPNYLEKPCSKKILVHNGWAKGYSGIHILYGINTLEHDFSELVRVFEKMTGQREGVILNARVSKEKKFITAIAVKGRLLDIYASSREVWLGLFTGIFSCHIAKGEVLDQAFYKTIEFIEESIALNDPLGYVSSRLSEYNEVINYMKYAKRLVENSVFNKLVKDHARLYIVPSNSRNALAIYFIKSTGILYPLGPEVVSIENINEVAPFSKQALCNKGVYLIIPSTRYLSKELLDILRSTPSIKVDIRDHIMVLKTSSLKSLVVSLEKIHGKI